MDDILAFFLGMLTVIIILFIVWLAGTYIPSFKVKYRNAVCYDSNI